MKWDDAGSDGDERRRLTHLSPLLHTHTNNTTNNTTTKSPSCGNDSVKKSLFLFPVFIDSMD